MYLLKYTLPQELEQVADCHRSCFPSSLSSQLGRAYRIKSMEWFTAGKNRFLFHIVENNMVVGYCGGFISMYKGDGSTSGIIQYAMPQAVKGVLKRPWLLFSREIISMYPLIIKNITRRFFHANQTSANSAKQNVVNEQKVGLVVIGVHPQYRGKGIFEMLMHEFEKQTAQRRISKMILSVKKNNARAVAAYNKAGWKVSKENNNTLEMMKIIQQEFNQ